MGMKKMVLTEKNSKEYRHMCSEKQFLQKFYKNKLVHGRVYDGESAQEKISENSPPKT